MHSMCIVVAVATAAVAMMGMVMGQQPQVAPINIGANPNNNNVHLLPTTTWVTDPLTGITSSAAASSVPSARAVTQPQQLQRTSAYATQPGRNLSPADAAASIAGMIMNPFIGYQQSQMQRSLLLEQMLAAQADDDNRISGQQRSRGPPLLTTDYSSDNSNDDYGTMSTDDGTNDDTEGRRSTRFAPGDDPTCGRIDTCRRCAQTSGCGWCSSSSACVAGDRTGPYRQPDNWSSCSSRMGSWHLYPGQCGGVVRDPWRDTSPDDWWNSPQQSSVNYPFSNQAQPLPYNR